MNGPDPSNTVSPSISPPSAGFGEPIDAFSHTAEEFVRRGKAELGLGRPALLRAYRDAFTTGPDTLLSEGLTRSIAPIASVMTDEGPDGTTIKFTQAVPSTGSRLADDLPRLHTESVLIPMIGRRGQRTYTLCVSSQIGCAMGCTFCETAQMGLIRSLSAAEIVGQWYAASRVVHHPELDRVREVEGAVVRNIVFMGMGEPLDNLDNVLLAIEILGDHLGASMPISRVTISTVGRVDSLKKLGERLHRPGWHRLNLAVSLNASDDVTRSTIMPINRKYDMGELQNALINFPIFGGGKICVEYVLIPGVNDTRDDARRIAAFLDPINLEYQRARKAVTARAMINLIPYNPRRSSPWPAPAEEHVDQFLAWLTEEGVYCKRRRTKGRDLMGACGQLGAEHIRQRKIVPLTIS